MSTMNVSLPEAMKTFVDEQVSERGYSTSSEYVRELIRRDQDRMQLRGLLLAGASSSPAAPGEGAYAAALGLVDAMEQAYAHISRHAATGSPRYAHELNLPGLCAWPLIRYPCLVFYVERPDHIDVWRVLHGQRDVPAWMQEPDANV